MQYKRLHIHKYKCCSYYEEPILHEYLVLFFRCQECNKKKTKTFAVDPALHLLNKDKEKQ